MDPVGQASKARRACRRRVALTGWCLTNDVSVASPNTSGAIWRHASQSIQVASTKKSPGTFSSTRFWGLAIGALLCPFYTRVRFAAVGSRQSGVGKKLIQRFEREAPDFESPDGPH